MTLSLSPLSTLAPFGIFIGSVRLDIHLFGMIRLRSFISVNTLTRIRDQTIILKGISSVRSLSSAAGPGDGDAGKVASRGESSTSQVTISSQSKFKGVDILDSEDAQGQSRMNVVGFGPTTFQINDVLVRQSALILPTKFYLWKPKELQDITIESLNMFLVVHPRIEILFVGTGATVQPIPDEVIDFYRQKGISVEASDSKNAAATFNVMCLEGRQVGCALLTMEPWQAREYLMP